MKKKKYIEFLDREDFDTVLKDKRGVIYSEENIKNVSKEIILKEVLENGDENREIIAKVIQIDKLQNFAILISIELTKNKEKHNENG